MSGFLFDSFHHGLGNVLDLRSQQHALTASNLANADTPEYKARYIAFDRILSEAVGTGDDLAMTRLSSLHMPGTSGDVDRPHIETVEAPPWAADGNSVNLERETVRLTENAMMYGAVSKGLSKRLAMLRFAASNGRS
ncbi:MAG: flagellar basal-body rod protein FlgB [Myxococcota bacterium]|jgi:flagellar basal-body rod protein FlgB